VLLTGAFSVVSAIHGVPVYGAQITLEAFMRSHQIAIVGSSTTRAFVVVPIAQAASESGAPGRSRAPGGRPDASKRALTAVLPASHRQ
jgi:hypothetical protein